MAQQSKLKSAWHGEFIRHLRQRRTFAEAARLVGVGLDVLYHERRRNADFAKTWDEAEVDSADKSRLSW